MILIKLKKNGGKDMSENAEKKNTQYFGMQKKKFR